MVARYKEACGVKQERYQILRSGQMRLTLQRDRFSYLSWVPPIPRT